jgi:hypothetical protein
MNDSGTVALSIKRFVRESLGCTCPDEVFDTVKVIENSDVFTPENTVYEIGGRLLVAVFVAETCPSITADLGQLVDAGIGYRDQRGYNRFRLVIVLDNDDATARLQKIFDALPARDEKTHLHVIKPEVLP